MRIAHESGGPASTDSLLFDLDRNNTTREYAGEVDGTGLTRVSATFDPGLYCYILLRPEGLFTSFAQLGLRVGFESEAR